MDQPPPPADQPNVVVVFPDGRREPATWVPANGYFWARRAIHPAEILRWEPERPLTQIGAKWDRGPA
jgi:hypothetical protein